MPSGVGEFEWTRHRATLSACDTVSTVFGEFGTSNGESEFYLLRGHAGQVY